MTSRAGPEGSKRFTQEMGGREAGQHQDDEGLDTHANPRMRPRATVDQASTQPRPRP